MLGGGLPERQDPGFGGRRRLVAADTGGTLSFFQLDPLELRDRISNWTEIFSVACAPNGRGVAIGLGWGEAITLWSPDADGEKRRYVLGGHQHGTNAVAFSPDSAIIASGGKDGKIKIWDVGTRRMLAEATADRGAVMSVAFSPDGKQLASAGADHQIRLWSVDELKAVPREEPRFPKVEEPPRPVVLHHAEEPRLVGELKRLGAVFLAKGARPSWSPDATRIVYVSVPDSELQILDLVTGKVRSLGEIGRDPAWLPIPGRWIAYTSGRQIAEFMGTRSRSAPLLDAPRGDEEIRLIDSSGGPPRKMAEGYAPAWSADAKTLYFISGEDQKVKSVEVKDDGSPGTIKDLFGISIHSLVAAISPAGRRVAYLGDGRLVVADREGDKTMPTWPVRHLRDWLLGWSPDGKQLGGINVWGFGGLVFLNQDTGRAVRLGAGEVVAPAWSPDGSMIAFNAHLVYGSEIWMIDAKALAAR
ncbi:MAG: WD40 repeat domain-containing protein, partial [Planctomycetia bacterium]|nr:WD40 repeat domain-containing protein [Planctomycetia bacterium]